MRVSPFYSLLRGMALANVWHDHDDCPLARSLAPADRRPGRPPSYAHCPYCALLARPLCPVPRPA